MPRKAHGRPPLPEWERQKDVILSFVSQYPWPVVIERMRKEHNFSARYERGCEITRDYTKQLPK